MKSSSVRKHARLAQARDEAAIAPVVDTRTIEEQRADDRVLAFEEIACVIKQSQRTLVDFHAAVLKDGPTYAMRWRGEDAMRAEKIGVEAWKLLSFLVLPAAVADRTEAEVLDVLRGELVRIVRELVGNDGWSSGRGPWSHNSTCAISNVSVLVDCDALRAMHSLISGVVRMLTKRDGAA